MFLQEVFRVIALFRFIKNSILICRQKEHRICIFAVKKNNNNFTFYDDN